MRWPTISETLRRRIRVPRACGRTSPHAARTEPRDTRAAAPPPPHATLANGGDRAPRRVQAQSPQAPHVGIWTRTTGFWRGSLSDCSGSPRSSGRRRRATLHLVTRRDYALLRAAFPWETKQAKQLAPSLRALAAGGPVTSTEALAHLESIRTHRRRCAPRLADGAPPAHIVQHHERPCGSAQRATVCRDRGTGAHVPVEARAEIFRRYLAAFGPSTRRDIGAWSMIRVAEIDAALELLEPLRRFRDEHGRELLDVPRAPLPDAETPAPVRFLPKWDNVLLAWADRTRVLPEAVPEDGDQDERRRRADVPRRRLVPGSGASMTAVSCWSRSSLFQPRRGARSRTRQGVWRRSSASPSRARRAAAACARSRSAGRPRRAAVPRFGSYAAPAQRSSPRLARVLSPERPS